MRTNTTKQKVNEKGLTREQFDKKIRSYHNRNVGFICLISLAYVGNAAYQVFRPSPVKPENHQTYLDARETLSALQTKRNRLADELNLEGLSYKTPEVNEALAGISNLRDNQDPRINILDNAVSIVKTDVSRMEPEISAYEEGLRRLESRRLIYALSGVLPYLAAAVAGRVFLGRKEKKLGSANFTYDPSQLPILTEEQR